MKLCNFCGKRIDPALTTAGITTHPNCAPDVALTPEQVRDAIGLLVRQLGARPTESRTK